jgi:hypothetical protein
MNKLELNDVLLDFIKSNVNDQDLGKEVRKYLMAYSGPKTELLLEYPNDFDLGKEIRKNIK